MSRRPVFSRYLRAAGGGSAAKLIAAASGTLVLWQLNQLLGKAGFGQFIVALTISRILAQIVSSGFSQTLMFRVSRLERDPEGIEIARRMLGTTVLFGGVFACVAAWGLASSTALFSSFGAGAGLEHWLVAVSFLLPADALHAIVTSWYRASQRIRIAIVFQIVIPALLLPLLLGIAMIFGVGDANPRLLGALYAASYLLPVAVLLLRETPVFSPRKRVFERADISYGAKLMFTQVSSRPARQVDLLVVGFLAVPEVTAEYAVASKLARFLLFGKNALSLLLVPRIGYLLDRERGQSLRAEFSGARDAALLVAALGGAVFLVFGQAIMSIFGDYSASATLLVLTAAMLVRVGAGPSGNFLVMAGHAGRNLTASVLGMMANVALAFAWVPTHGVVGAAAAFLAAVSLQNAYCVWSVWELNRFASMDRYVTAFLGLMVAILLMQAFGLISLVSAAAAMLPALLGFGGLLGWRLRRNWAAEASDQQMTR